MEHMSENEKNQSMENDPQLTQTLQLRDKVIKSYCNYILYVQKLIRNTEGIQDICNELLEMITTMFEMENALNGIAGRLNITVKRSVKLKQNETQRKKIF